jgi:hypothetical protein
LNAVSKQRKEERRKGGKEERRKGRRKEILVVCRLNEVRSNDRKKKHLRLVVGLVG